MPDRYKGHANSLDGPAAHRFSINPGDVSGRPETTRAIYVGTPGDLPANLASRASVIFINTPSGMVLPARVNAVKAIGASASDLIGLV